MPRRKSTGKSDMPSAIAKSEKPVQELWKEVHARSVNRYGEGPSADRVAYAVLKNEYKEQGDRWVRKTNKRPSNPQHARDPGPHPSSTESRAPTARGRVAHSGKRERAQAKQARREHARNRRPSQDELRGTRSERRNREAQGGNPKAKNKIVVVDGSNIAYAERAKDGKPQVSNLIAVQRALQARGWQPIIIVDAALRHQVDDPARMEALIQHQEIRQAPADTDADYFILKTAENEHADVVSNDEYQPYRQQFQWIAKRRIPLMIVRGAVELYEPAHDGKR
jgi:hypothetical protein